MFLCVFLKQLLLTKLWRQDAGFGVPLVGMLKYTSYDFFYLSDISYMYSKGKEKCSSLINRL